MKIKTKMSKEYKERYKADSVSVENLIHYKRETTFDLPEDKIARLKAATLKVPMFDPETRTYPTIEIPVLEVSAVKPKKKEVRADG